MSFTMCKLGLWTVKAGSSTGFTIAGMVVGVSSSKLGFLMGRVSEVTLLDSRSALSMIKYGTFKAIKALYIVVRCWKSTVKCI